MDPNAALERQIEAYRRMSGEQRLAIALRLHELPCNVVREGIRNQLPDATDEEVERELRRRLELARTRGPRSIAVCTRFLETTPHSIANAL